MRNDSYDDPTHWPQLRAEAESIADISWSRRSARTGGLWALLWLLLLSVLGLSWWFDQRMMQLEQQLIATQHNFVRLSEANSRAIQALERQREPLVDSATETLSKAEFEVRLEQLSQRLDSLVRQQPLLDSQQQVLHQELVALRQQRIVGDESLQALTQRLMQQEQVQQKHQQSVLTDWNDWKAQQEQQVQQQLKLNMSTAAALSNLEQELLVLRSSIERLPKPAAVLSTKPSISVQEFDLFRAQMTRNITSLQAQVANLQEQLDRR
ncbi:hypothetical protein LX59_00140 [Azomonas agilis]|uniref:ATPase n=1 Tax=Azomonas agilis TaxID=116849 RepID=A0A562J347_9GAMM|nr:hypothetical protein [Azomonas agilis]TWH77235.1 hypothetical protein LX59_00140 [Azomonas agilis]